MKKILFLVWVSLLTNSTIAQTIADAELKAFSNKLNQIITSKNGAAFDQLINKNFTISKYSNNVNAKAFMNGAYASLNLGSSIILSVKDGGSYDYVKKFTKNDKSHILYRLITADMGLNYHELALSKVNGAVMIDDIYIYVSGENISETLINAYKSIKTETNKMSGNEEAEALQIAKVNMPKIRALNDKGEYEKAYESLLKLPDFVQNMKMVRLMKLMISQNFENTDRYEKDMADYRKYYPEAKNIDLVSIDAYLLKKQYDNAMRAVNNLDKSLDGDPYLDFYRYLISNLKQDTASTLIYIVEASKSFPDKEFIQLQLLINYKEFKKEEELKVALAAYKANPKFDQSKLSLLDLE
jgi:hypothetical protein